LSGPRARPVAAGLAFAALALFSCTTSPLLEAMVTRVEQTRGIEAPRPIDARVVDEAGMRDLIEAAIVQHRTPEEIAAYEAGLVAVGLWPPDRDLLEEFLSVMAEEVAGVYLQTERALVVLGERDARFDEWLGEGNAVAEFALAHEVVHLLQHRRYPLLMDTEVYFSQDDLALAVQAALEGDAMYYGTLALGGEPPRPALLEAMFEVQVEDSDGALATAPELLRALLAFPYVQGYRLAVSEAADLLDDPPASTEQTIHPDRRREPFFDFDLSSLHAAIPEGCTLVTENTVGELQLSILLSRLAKPPVGEAAWIGWDGDRYLAARCDGRLALLWLTAWDSEDDAAEFEVAYAGVAQGLADEAGLESPLQGIRVEREVVLASRSFANLAEEASARAKRRRVTTVDELLGTPATPVQAR
jgi:hypothetical protein